MNILYLVLSFAIAAQASTYVKNPAPRSTSLCDARGKFLKPQVDRVSVRKGSRDFDVDSVYWIVDLSEVSHSGNCPPLGQTKIRIRGATFKGIPSAPEITYAVDLHEPTAGDSVSVKIEFVQGLDTFSNRNYSDWILKELGE